MSSSYWLNPTSCCKECRRARRCDHRKLINCILNLHPNFKLATKLLSRNSFLFFGGSRWKTDSEHKSAAIIPSHASLYIQCIIFCEPEKKPTPRLFCKIVKKFRRNKKKHGGPLRKGLAATVQQRSTSFYLASLFRMISRRSL